MECLDYSTFSVCPRSPPGLSCPKSPLCWILSNPTRLLVGLEHSSLMVSGRSNEHLEAVVSSTAQPQTLYKPSFKVLSRKGRSTSPYSPTRQIYRRRGHPNRLPSLLRSRTTRSRPSLLATIAKKLAGTLLLRVLDADSVSRFPRREGRASFVHVLPLRTRRAALKIGPGKLVNVKTLAGKKSSSLKLF